MMNKLISYLRCSGIWVGLVINPYHWQFGWKRSVDELNSNLFENAVHFGPLWIRVVVDDGRW